MKVKFKKNNQSGFTLVELIVVILVLGILAATALPKFINVSSEARVSSVNGIAGALRSAVSLAQAKYFAAGNTAATTVTLQDGTTATVTAGTGRYAGVPAGTLAGIGAMIQDLSGFTVSYTTPTAVTIRPNGGSATCQATYNGTTGAVAAVVTSC
jgi:MSHA pilin protein MshA